MFKIINKANKFFMIKTMNVNFGPQHPAAHGVLRLVLCLEGEKITNCDPHIGLLHRGSEHLITTKPFYLSLPYFDRMDYVSMMCQEHAYCISVEKLTKNFFLPSIIKKTRIILDEITRILNHLLAIACHALDVGSMSPIFWSFEERENIMEIYEYVSGARMHAAFYRPSFGNKLLNSTSLRKVIYFTQNINPSLSEINSTLSGSKTWKSRLVGVGLLNKAQLLSNSLSGVFIRSMGIKNDFRKFTKISNTSYSYYNLIKFNSFYTINGDSFDRYLLRMFEMLESSSISARLSLSITDQNNNLILNFFKYMEGTIDSFKLWSGLKTLDRGTSVSSIESPKGLFGVTLVSDGSSIPSLCKVRSPSYNSLNWLGFSVKNNLLSDLITLIGTIDIVFGEIDR